MEPADRAFDKPAARPEPMFRGAAFRNHGLNSEPTKDRPECLIIERLIRNELLRVLLRPARLAFDFRHVHEQRDQRCHIMLVGG